MLAVTLGLPHFTDSQFEIFDVGTLFIKFLLLQDRGKINITNLVLVLVHEYKIISFLS